MKPVVNPRQLCGGSVWDSRYPHMAPSRLEAWLSRIAGSLPGLAAAENAKRFVEIGFCSHNPGEPLSEALDDCWSRVLRTERDCLGREAKDLVCSEVDLLFFADVAEFRRFRTTTSCGPRSRCGRV